MKMSKETKKLMVSALFVIVLLIAGTFAWIRIGYNGNSINKLVAGTLDMTLDESASDGIKIQKAIPIPYREGIKTTEYEFTLKNTGDYTVGYKISFEDVDELELDSGETIQLNENNKIADRFVRFLVVKNGEEKEEENTKLISETEDRTIDSGILAATEENTYKLQVWIDYDAGDNGTTPLVMNRYFNTRLKIDAIQSDGTKENDDDPSTKRYALVFNGNGGTSKTVVRSSNERVGEMPSSVREGHTFLGWFTDAENGTEITEDTPITREKETYYAHWQINEYTITFDGNGGSDCGTHTDYYHQPLGTLPESERIGHTFGGWWTQATGGERVTAETLIPALDTTYYAHWDINQYRVSFDSNGEGASAVADIVGDYDTELGTLTDSVRRGYVFDGWWTEREGGEEINEHTKIGATDVVYYAHWIIDYFDVTYDFATNGGTSADKTTDVVINGDPVDLSPIAYKDGYEFVGWNTDSTATTKLDSLQMGRGDLTIYAIYKKKVTANFHNNGASLSSNAVSCYIYNNGTSCTSESVAPTITRADYVIKGFSTVATSTDKEDTAPVQGQNFSIGLAGADYYAITSQLQTSTAYYYGNEGQATLDLNCTMYNTDTECTYPLPNNLITSSGPNETEYVGLSKTKSSASLESEITSENSVYYAVYKVNITSTFYYYDVTLKTTTSSGYRTATTDEATYTTVYDDITIPNEVIVSRGPNRADYTGVSKDKNDQTNINTTSEYKKYYAFYNGTWTVEYKKDNNTVDSVDKSRDSCPNYASTDEETYSTVGINCSRTLPNITEKTGYTKDGWYEDLIKVGVSGGDYTITKNVTLIAKANINTYTVTYNAHENGGTTAATQASVDYNHSIDLTPEASKDAYDFLGWNTDKNATEGLTELVMGTNDVTLYAIFKKSTTISLSAIGPTPYTGSEVIANEAVVNDGNPTPTVTYTYYTDSSCTTPTPTSTGASVAGGAPIDVGEYYVQAEVAAVNGETPKTTYKSAKSNCVTHTIIQKDISVVWGPTEFDYNGNPQGPTANITSVIPNEILAVTRTSATNAGTHTSEATVTVAGGRAKMSNYNVTNPTQRFVINTIDNTLELSADKSVIYTTDSTTFEVTENVSDGELSVVDDNETANVSISGTTVTISNLSTINAGTVIKVTVTSGATTNYKQATAIYNLTIIRRNPVFSSVESKELTYGTAEDISYTYDGDGVVSCSTNTTYLTCSVNQTTKKITLTPVQATSTPVNVVLSAAQGANYNAANNVTVPVTIEKKAPQLTVAEDTKTVTYDDPKTVSYTYNGDGTVRCASADDSKLACSVDAINKVITLTPVEVTNTPIVVTVSVDAGVNYLESQEKTITVTLKKATPVITLSGDHGSMYVGSTLRFTERANVAGTFTNESSESAYISVAPTSIAVSANSSTAITLTGRKTNGTKSKSSTITVYFTPTDTTNYNVISLDSFSSDAKTFTATVNPYTFRATFTAGPNSSIESTAESCTTRNANTTCTVIAPEIYPDTGFISQGWTKVSGTASPNTVDEGGSITLSDDATYKSVVVAE